MRVSTRVLLTGLLLAGTLAGGLWLWWVDSRQETVQKLVLYGNIDIREVDLAFNGSERIARMLVEEGSRVEQGQLLAVLDTERLEHAAAQLEAEVAAQEQVVARLEAGSRPEEIRRARAEAEAALVEARDLARTARRLRFLASRDEATEDEADRAEARARAARARLTAARQTLTLALKGPRQEEVAEARATLRADQAALALARRRLEDGFLHAPANGIIRNRILEPGNMASPERPVYSLALMDPLWVRAYVPEPDLGKIHPGMTAWVTTDSFPGKRYAGWIGFISPTAEFTPKSVETPDLRTRLVYQVRVFVCNPEGELRLGMPATVTIPLDQAKDQRSNVPPDPCSKNRMGS